MADFSRNMRSHGTQDIGSSHDNNRGYVYKSPLEEKLVELRRKYVAAAGPQVGSGSADSFLMEYSLLPSTHGRFHSDVAVDDDEARNRSTGMNMSMRSSSHHERRRSMQMARSGSMIFNGRRPSLNNGRSVYTNVNASFSPYGHCNSGDRASSDNVSPRAVTSESQGTMPISFEFLDQRAAFMECASRYRSGLASTSHEENLIACAPHLRHISAASAEMQGGGISTMNPIAAFILNKKRGGETVNATENSVRVGVSGVGVMTTISDYRSCLARKHTNDRVALELATFVRVLANEMPLEEFGIVEGEIFSTILGFMNSNDNNKRLAGIAALNALIGVTSADEEKKATKFAKNLSHGLKAANVDFEFLSVVTKAVGKMALGSANVDYVESEITRAVEWLKKERSDRR